MTELVALVIAENSDGTGEQLRAASGLLTAAANDIGAETISIEHSRLSMPEYSSLLSYYVGVYIDDGSRGGGDDTYPPGYINFFFRSERPNSGCAIRFADRMYEGSFPPPGARSAVASQIRHDLDRAASRGETGRGWLPLLDRSDQLERRDLQSIGVGVEPLVGAAHRLLDELAGEDAAELESLTQVLEAEMRNPRPDSVALERAVSRLSAAVSAHADPSKAAQGLIDVLGIDEASATALADRLTDLARDQVLGVADPAADREAATSLLGELSDRVAALEQAVAERVSARPDDEVSQRLHRIEERLAKSWSGWPQAIGQNLAAAAIWQLMFDGLGLGGVALKALAWTMIAIYKIVGFG
ncbi:MAG: hypothetical protein U0Q03_19300 [Acidimicrobiales bacterium]